MTILTRAGTDPFGARAQLSTAAGDCSYYRLGELQDAGLARLDALPLTVKILLEGLLRISGTKFASAADVAALAGWKGSRTQGREISFLPARVLLQDFTGVPAVVDLAAMRSAIRRAGGDPSSIDPLLPVDLVIDHSVQVDSFGSNASFAINVDREYERNRERYALLRWAQQAFSGFRVVPPGMGIVHQVNLEHLASVVQVVQEDGDPMALPDTVVGTDSHTPMINGLGVLGWGVGGIEAEAALLGQPIPVPTPVVVGVRLTGGLPLGVTATDLVLTVTEMLRAHGVVGKFVEFWGDGVANLAVADRATLSNMSPEFGATASLWPVDDQTLTYLRLTGRDPNLVDLVERYCKEQGLWADAGSAEPDYSERLQLDLTSVEPSLAGPRRPQDRVSLNKVWSSFTSVYPAPQTAEGNGDAAGREAAAENNGAPITVRAGAGAGTSGGSVGGAPGTAPGDDGAPENGSVVIAAITSCTNTSNPTVMLAAGLLAQKAVEKGLAAKPWVKTSLAPGSRVVTDYLEVSGVTPYLDKLGFHVVGYGCTTCIGNSGPLPPDVAAAVEERDLVAVSVLSGNRNFEGRIHPQVQASYLASPPLVVAYALAGTVNIDMTRDPLGYDSNGDPVYLWDIWPAADEVEAALAAVTADLFQREYATVFEGDERWAALPSPTGALYEWDPDSTYVREPPFFEGIDRPGFAAPIADEKDGAVGAPRSATDTNLDGPSVGAPKRPTKDLEDAAVATPERDGATPSAKVGSAVPLAIHGARALVVAGDSVTTDHISPAGAIAPASPAGRYLIEHGVAPQDFNSYGSRRGNHEVMVRGTFANIRLRNMLASRQGGWTTFLPTGEEMPIYDAAMRYQAEGIPLLVLAGREYGSGSSRDWAAKGPSLLGVSAVIGQSFERIHRSNLVGMGILPLQLASGDGWDSLGISGQEIFSITSPPGGLEPRGQVNVTATSPDGATTGFNVECRIDSEVEMEYYRTGGVLQKVLTAML